MLFLFLGAKQLFSGFSPDFDAANRYNLRHLVGTLTQMSHKG